MIAWDESLFHVFNLFQPVLEGWGEGQGEGEGRDGVGG